MSTHSLTIRIQNEDGTLRTREEVQAEAQEQFNTILKVKDAEKVLLDAADALGGLNRAISFLMSQRKETPLTEEDKRDIAIGEMLCPMDPAVDEPARNYIFTHSGCRSTEVREAVGLGGAEGKNRWAYILQKLSKDPQIQKRGNRNAMRFFALEAVA